MTRWEFGQTRNKLWRKNIAKKVRVCACVCMGRGRYHDSVICPLCSDPGIDHFLSMTKNSSSIRDYLYFIPGIRGVSSFSQEIQDLWSVVCILSNFWFSSTFCLPSFFMSGWGWSKDTATQHPALNDDTYEDTYSDEKWYSKMYGVCFDLVMPMGVTRKKSKNNFHRVMPPGHNSKKIRNYFSPSYAPRA